MSVLEKLQSNKKSFCSGILCALACFTVFSCQIIDSHSDSTIKANDTIAEQPEANPATQAANEFALPIVTMEAAPETPQPTPQTEEIEVFQLQVVEQKVITPAKKDASKGAKNSPTASSTAAKTEGTTATTLPVEQTKQTQAKQQTAPANKVVTEPKPATKTTTSQAKTRTAAAPRNRPQDRITTPGLLPTPMWIVVISTTANESDAIRISSQYWTLGYKSNYFWSPDYESTNEQVFKVFLGPFVSQAMAEQFVNERNDPNFQIVYLQ